MQHRKLGRTGLEVSILGFGCGAVGGLMVRGSDADQERAVARAVELGINYFDTAPSYGDGVSERNLGRVLAKLRPDVFVGTKIRLRADEKADIGRAIAAGLEASLKRLGRDHVDLFQLHNPITANGDGETLTARMVIEQVAPAFEAARAHGKTSFFGITAIGDTEALLQVVDSRKFDTAQVSYNLLNPSAGMAVAAGFPGQDYDNLLHRLHAGNMGAIGIRVLAGGALTGEAARHPIASLPPEPIGSGPDYDSDLFRARTMRVLIEQGHASSLVEAAIRFALSHPAQSTTLIGIATPEQFEVAASAAAKGPLPEAALAAIRELQAGFR